LVSNRYIDEQYIKMAEGYDGGELIEKLKKFLPINSTILEIGMGSGKGFENIK